MKFIDDDAATDHDATTYDEENKFLQIHINE
jgi:hypothetical protein